MELSIPSRGSFSPSLISWMPELDCTCQLCFLHFTTRSTLLHCENSFFQRTAFHRCKLERPTEVSDCIIWFLWEWIWSGYQISLTTIKQQLAYVYLQIAPNVAQHKCSAQVPNGANGAQQWSQELIVQDQLRTWPGWLGAELGPDEIFWTQRTSTSHSSRVWLYNKHCHVGLHKYAWTNLGPRQWLKFWTTTMCIWVFAFGYSDELRTCTCHVCRER